MIKEYVFKGDEEIKFTATANKTHIIEFLIFKDETILRVDELDD